MGKMRYDLVILGVLLVFLLALRLEISTNVDSLTYDSYLTVRDVEHIQNTGLPLHDDPLSVTGAKRVSNPIYNYLLAVAVFVTPAAYKVLPNIFMVLLLIPLYFLAQRLTKSISAAMVAVVLAGVGPLVFSSYLNTPAPVPAALFLLVSIIAMLHDPDKYVFPIVVMSILLTFISPLIFILVLALLATVILQRLEGFGVDQRLNELFLFTLMLSLWFYVIMYKRAFFNQGLSVLWQNLPSEFAALSFRNITFLDAINGLGVITFLLGTIGMYQALFETRDKTLYPIIGAALAAVLALTLRVVTVELGLIILALPLSIMAGYGLMLSIAYIRRTKAPWIVYPFVTLMLLLFVFSSVLPALVNAKSVLQNSPSEQDIATYNTLRKLPIQAVLLTPVDEGAAVQYFSDRKTVTDNDFLMVTNGDALVRDIDSVYTSHFSTPVISRRERLGFSHILLSQRAAQEYNRTRLFSEGPCLQPQQLPNGILYTVTCEAVE